MPKEWTPLRIRRTKIIATAGPACGDVPTLSRLIAAGVDVFRLNFSHGSHSQHRQTWEKIQQAAQQSGRTVAVLADLCGPKIRVGELPGGSVELREGSQVTVSCRPEDAALAGEGMIPTTYTALSGDVRPGDRILLDDGNLELRVEESGEGRVRCAVVQGGLLKSRKGINLPGVAVSAPALTAKDAEDARFAMGLGIRLFALSFVRKPSDVMELRALADQVGEPISIIAKIEKPEALEAIAGILECSDGIMVARGDLGVETDPESVPEIQEELIHAARQARRPVIVATQMLESMITNPRPTRAEASDVANAVRAGADAIMLSGETAVGKHPLEAVHMMDLLARQTEQRQWQRGAFGSLRLPHPSTPPIPVEDAIAEASAQISRNLMVRAIVVLSRSGRSVAVMSSSRPGAPVVGVGGTACTRQLCHLLWGVVPAPAAPDGMGEDALAATLAHRLGLAQPGQPILLVRGFRTESAQNRPSITVVLVGASPGWSAGPEDSGLV